MVVGPLGIGKEALGYWFVQSGLSQGDQCLYNTRLSVSEIIHDAKGFGIDFAKPPVWLAVEGGQMKYDLNNLAALSYSIKEFVKENKDRRTRVVLDSISSLLMLNQMDSIYRFLAQLFTEVKQYNCVVLATLEEGMHPSQVISTMGQLFDGVVELRMYEEGLRAVPLLRIRKMRGSPPNMSYFSYRFSERGMEVMEYAKEG